MSKRSDIKRILVIGSGPIIIGQGAEFDYAGTQACLALKEEGYSVILVNSNPATIMTDKQVADTVYIEPLTKEFLIKIIKKERPDALLPTLGGQIGLNLTVQLHESGILDEYQVEILGTGLRSIKLAEDRDLFRGLMQQIKEPVPRSEIVNNIEQAIDFATKIGFPVIVRPAYTMGGTGGGICNDLNSLREIVSSGLSYSPINQCLIEESIAGWKEIEYEVLRDKDDTAIVVTNMENIDPIGIHTGDSIVVAPTQTLTDKENHLLRNAALKIIRALGIEGGCNIQFALDPKSFNYYVIEVNPRVSRSSALASKATGYPIAKIAAKIAIGLSLDEIVNPVTGRTLACFEPALDYIVTKLPRFPFDKFPEIDRRLGTQMKATGEVMAIGRCFEESLLKAIRSLEEDISYPQLEGLSKIGKEELLKRIAGNDDKRLVLIFEAIRRKVTTKEINEITDIDLFFLEKFQNIIDMERVLGERKLDIKTLKLAKKFGISDHKISQVWGLSELEIFNLRRKNNIIPTYKMIDTCAAEFESSTPYFYSTYGEENESVRNTKRERIIVLGSGPIRIGQGVEFDYATVHAILEIKRLGYEAIVINNNPETVSTDFSLSDKLYFEPLTIEDVMAIVELEEPLGVVVQFGGQTAINLTKELVKRGVKILGSSLEAIDISEDRKRFGLILKELGIPQPKAGTALDIKGAIEVARKLSFPLLVRPSYVLGGRAMQVVYNEDELIEYIDKACKLAPDLPILIDRYIPGKEVEVDAISDGNNLFIAGILEHIEAAGVHSGDSIAVYPTQTISEEDIKTIHRYTNLISKRLGVKGLINIQYLIFEGEVYLLEVNLRSSRTVPFIGKIRGISLPKLAIQAILGEGDWLQKIDKIKQRDSDLVYVKMPVFSFSKLRDIDITLGPEMRSTGEVMGVDSSLIRTLFKGFLAAGYRIKEGGSILISSDKENIELARRLARRFERINYTVYKTKAVAGMINEGTVLDIDLKKGLIEPKRNKRIDVLLSLSKQNPSKDSFEGLLRGRAIIQGVNCFTNYETCNAFFKVLDQLTSQVYQLIEG